MNNSKLAVTNKCFISETFIKHDGDRFCLNCFSSFKTDEKLEQRKTWKNHDHTALEIPEWFKAILN